MALGNLLSTNAFLVAYALSEQAGTRASPAPVSAKALRTMKAVADMPDFAFHAALQELADQKMLEITRTESGKDDLGIAAVRATRALLEYVDSFGL